MSRLMRGDVSGRVRLIGAAAPYPRLAKTNVRREPDLCPVRRWSICDQDKCDTAHIYLQHIHIADNHRTAAPPGLASFDRCHNEISDSLFYSAANKTPTGEYAPSSLHRGIKPAWPCPYNRTQVRHGT
jgi:hypothetical protein